LEKTIHTKLANHITKEEEKEERKGVLQSLAFQKIRVVARLPGHRTR